ncbi:MAG: phospholipase, partial [Solirubrobacteraceae bacterium]|nr:phospholipase [Solirubrobacteraceae bacterium]
MPISDEMADTTGRWARTRDAMLVSKLRRGIAGDELVLYCQPHVDAQTGELRGAEALIRWQHPTRGLLAPAAWLPQVEETRHRTGLNLHIIELALEHRAAWVRQGIDLPMAVNVTPACLADEEFVAGVERLFTGPGAADRWRLELTEQATVFDGLAIDESVKRLRDRGFEFMLDDFGAEYSSLSRLALLPFSTLKIDGSLVSDMAHSRAHRSVTHAAIQLAHTLGLEAIGE